jgi:CDP-glycerol glycerophosphotransferase
MHFVEHFIKKNPIIQHLYKMFFSFFFRLIGLFIKIDPNLVLVTGHGGGVNDSPLEIYLYLRNHKKYQNLNIIWGISYKYIKDFKFEKFVILNSLDYFIVALKAKYWIASVNIERGLNFKKKGNIYLNTWHGIPYKKIGNSVKNRHDFNFSNIDFFCVTSEYEVPIYVNDLKVKKEAIIKSGLPRNDKLYTKWSSDKIAQFKIEHNLPLEKQIVLYAPTWRQTRIKNGKYEFDLPFNLNSLRLKLGKDFTFVFRLHPYAQYSFNNMDNFIYNFSDYPDINDLIQVSDILITDYSAIFFDYLITRKPIYFFAYDYKKYIEKRGLYLDLFKDYPDLFCFDSEELIQRLLNNDNKRGNLNLNFLYKKFIQYGLDGNATKQVVERTFENV